MGSSIFLHVFLLSCALLSQQAPRDAPRQTGSSRIRGVVLDAARNAPLPGAHVQLTGVDFNSRQEAETDELGTFEMTRVAPGRYALTAAMDGYVPGGFGQSGPLDPQHYISVAAQQSFERVTLMLSPGGVITGSIVDERGSPVANVQVTAMRRITTAAKSELSPSGRAVASDDRGEFRVYGLAPGRYYVLATPSVMLGNRNRRGNAPTYYPGVSDAQDARSIAIDARGTSTVNITLATTSLASIQGIVPGAGGNGRLAVTIMRAAARIGQTLSVGPDGGFRSPLLPPGIYYLHTQTPGSGAGQGHFVATVALGQEDVSGVVLEPVRPSILRGHITGAAGPAAFGSGALRLAARPVAFSGFYLPSLPPPLVRTNGTFEMAVWPGVMSLQLLSPAMNWGLRSVRLKGADVTDSGFEVTGGLDVADVDVEITDRLTEVQGSVRDDRERRVEDFVVCIFPQDTRRWNVARYFGLGRPDQMGQFRVAGLPPGQYLAAALPRMIQGECSDPEALSDFRARATSLTLRESESRSVQLVLISR